MKQQTQNKIEWREVELGNLGYFQVKKGERITKGEVSEGKVPVVAGGQQPAYYHNKSNRQGETITISGSGAYAGFVNYFKEPIFASDCSTVQIKKELISTKYIYLFLKSYQSKIYLLQKGIAQPHVYPKDIIKIKLPIPFSNGKPNIKEQERIVKILEKAEAIKQKGRKAEDLLDEYLKSVFYEMFLNKGFEEVELREITENLDSKRIPISQIERAKIKGDIPYYGACEIVDYINKYIFDEALLLIGEDGQNLVSRNKPMAFIIRGKSWVNNHAHVLRAKKNSHIEYLRFYLNLIDYSKYLSGSTQPKLNQAKLSGIKIPLPPLTLQQKFAKIVENIEKMKENVKKTKANSEELFNSLLGKAFKGEL